MTPDSIYTLLGQSLATPTHNRFDGHVLACLIAAGISEAPSGCSLSEAIGISGGQLRRLIADYFPGSLEILEPFGLDHESAIGDEEHCLRRLLLRSRSTPEHISLILSLVIARRATRPNHLWQDLGLVDRSELSALMLRHFAPLAHRNRQDMKWKKFFYRMICQDDSYRVCLAPSCSECADFNGCFGDESGPSLLAKARFRHEAPAYIYERSSA